MPYGGSNSEFFAYDFKNEKVLDILPLRAGHGFRAGSGTNFHVQGHEVWQLCEIQFVCILGSKSERGEFGGVAVLAGAGEVVFVDSPRLNDI